MTVTKPLKVGTVIRYKKDYWVVFISKHNDTDRLSPFWDPDCLYLHHCENISGTGKRVFFEKDLKLAKYISDLKSFKVKYTEYFV